MRWGLRCATNQSNDILDPIYAIGPVRPPFDGVVLCGYYAFIRIDSGMHGRKEVRELLLRDADPTLGRDLLTVALAEREPTEVVARLPVPGIPAGADLRAGSQLKDIKDYFVLEHRLQLGVRLPQLLLRDGAHACFCRLRFSMYAFHASGSVSRKAMMARKTSLRSSSSLCSSRSKRESMCSSTPTDGISSSGSW